MFRKEDEEVYGKVSRGWLSSSTCRVVVVEVNEISYESCRVHRGDAVLLQVEHYTLDLVARFTVAASG